MYKEDWFQNAPKLEPKKKEKTTQTRSNPELKK